MRKSNAIVPPYAACYALKGGFFMSTSRIFPHPFSKAYWRCALDEFRNTRILIFAALMIALRVIFKTISIPIAMDLRINTAFLINAFGAMVFGPVVAAAAAAITDTLGCLLFPTGPYFFPFIFEEIAGSVIFALFLYRADITPKRVILSRFCINFFVNIVLNTPIMMLYYEMMMGRYYAPFDALRIVKNLVLFPVEAVILMIFLQLTVPRVRRLGFTVGSTEALHLSKRHIASMTALFAAGCLAVGGYSYYAYEHTSLSASYTPEERMIHHLEMVPYVLQAHASLQEETVVTIVESAYPYVLREEIDYTVAVYRVQKDLQDLDEYLTLAFSYSKSPASKDENLSRIGTAQIVTDKVGAQLLSYHDDVEDDRK